MWKNLKNPPKCGPYTWISLPMNSDRTRVIVSPAGPMNPSLLARRCTSRDVRYSPPRNFKNAIVSARLRSQLLLATGTSGEVAGGAFGAKGMATVTTEIPLENPVGCAAIFKRALFRVASKELFGFGSVWLIPSSTGGTLKQCSTGGTLKQCSTSLSRLKIQVVD
jgi:hypothetical protein